MYFYFHDVGLQLVHYDLFRHGCYFMTLICLLYLIIKSNIIRVIYSNARIFPYFYVLEKNHILQAVTQSKLTTTKRIKFDG